MILVKRTALSTMLAVILAIFISPAVMAKTISLTGGAGVPELTNIRLQLIASPFFQVGVSYGYLPSSSLVSPLFHFSEKDYYRRVNNLFDIEPKLSMSMHTLSAFARVFPGSSVFYLEGRYTPLQLNGTIDGDLQVRDCVIVTPQASVENTMTLPAVSGGVGWQWTTTSGLFVDFGFGLMTFLTMTSALDLSQVDSSVRVASSQQSTTAAEQVIISTAIKDSATALDQAVQTFRRQHRILPSARLALGWTF